MKSVPQVNILLLPSKTLNCTPLASNEGSKLRRSTRKIKIRLSQKFIYKQLQSFNQIASRCSGILSSRRRRRESLQEANTSATR
jgi:hypothetical protein